jgi:hypothetical protein
MLQENRLLGRIEQRLRDLDVPLSITLWNGQRLAPKEQPRVNVTVHTPKVLASFVRPTMGKLARYYVEEDLDVEGEARQVIRVTEALSGTPETHHGKTARLRKWIGHTRAFDSRAIRQHYDVGDDFFGLWLDARRVYSCAYFKRADDSLDSAQEQKLDHICRKLMLRPTTSARLASRCRVTNTSMQAELFASRVCRADARSSCSTTVTFLSTIHSTKSQASECSNMSVEKICLRISARSIVCFDPAVSS